MKAPKLKFFEKIFFLAVDKMISGKAVAQNEEIIRFVNGFVDLASCQ